MTVKGTDPVGFSPDFRPTASPPNMYNSNTTITSLPRSHTTSPSVHSLPYDLSIINGPLSTSPPPPPSQQAMLASQASISGGHPQVLENVIVPYTMTSSSQDVPSTDRKRADGNLFPIFEQQNEYQGGPSNNQFAPRSRMNPPTYNESVTSGEPSVIRSPFSGDLKGRGHGHQGSSDTTDSSTTNGNGTESSWSPMPRRTQMVRDSALTGFSGITGLGSEFGPSSVVGVGSAAITSPTDSQARTNLMSVAGSVVGGDDIA
ncbi:hypothetical protein M378DRAFT_815686 [Amanita muscaria Koide BX008]|uniref:Uncharacterized protein n=1 Tax=Amanita muscaria (strain Koide BX008) TaxID=946122 RepID=A0A0C2WY79_AMAMK|nr:hypothetical protein M378DRAFT_815686 [Amanita muscaria Koide BX008]